MKNRFYQYELMRIFAMFLIVLHHICVHGIFGSDYNINSFNTVLFYPQALSIFGKVGVFLFAMVTGFFLIESKPRVKKIWSIVFLALFYLIIGFLFSIRGLYKLEMLSLVEVQRVFLESFYPLTGYWFINSYIILYVLAPYINFGINHLEKKDFEKLLLILIVILSFLGFFTSDYTPLGGFGNLFLGYLTGIYCKKFPLKIKISTLVICLILTIALTFFLIYIFDSVTLSNLMRKIILTPLFVARDNSIFMIVISVLIFLIMQRINIANVFVQKLIIILGNCMLGVYLLHDNRIIRYRIAFHASRFLSNPSFSIVFKILAIAIAVFIGCTLFELTRQIIMKVILKKKNTLILKD